MSTAVHGSRAALRACWHPVAYAADVATAPHATTLLGEPLVLRRDTAGAVHAVRNAVEYPAQERHGIVWAALEPPRWPIPDVPELDDPTWRTVRTGPFAWTCDASRQVENFTDFGHFAFVHPGLLGDPRNAVVAPHEVTVDGHVLRYAYGRPDAPQRVVESQRPDRVPFDLAAELHLTFDAVAVAYRRAMRAQGLS